MTPEENRGWEMNIHDDPEAMKAIEYLRSKYSLETVLRVYELRMELDPDGSIPFTGKHGKLTQIRKELGR